MGGSSPGPVRAHPQAEAHSFSRDLLAVSAMPPCWVSCGFRSPRYTQPSHKGNFQGASTVCRPRLTPTNLLA